MAPVKVFAVAVLLVVAAQDGGVEASCTSQDYTNYYNNILTCINGFTSDISGCSNFNCYCTEMGEYFDCLIGSVNNFCINSNTRTYLGSIISAYKTIVDQHCTGLISYPVYRVSFTIPNNYFSNFKQFSEAQYVAFCENVFDALGYSSSDYNTWCVNWGTYLTFSGLTSNSRARRGASDDLEVDVKVPEDQILPPDTDFSTLTVPYTDTSDNTQTGTASVSGVLASATKGSNAANLPQTVTVLATGLLTLLGAALAL